MTAARDPARLPIATLKKGPLHAGLKAWYARPGDRTEVPRAGAAGP